jgi:hypothetical protein
LARRWRRAATRFIVQNEAIMLHIDLPTMEQFRVLARTRADACVSLYLPTTTLSQHSDASRIELGNLLKEAIRQLEPAGLARGRVAALEGPVLDLIDDDEFWRFQANSLAVLATPDHIDTFRLPNNLTVQVEVSDRFHLKPLLRALTFPHTAFVLALAEGAVRLIEVLPSGPPVEVKVPGLPKDAASAAGKSSLGDRSPSGRIVGSEGHKVRLTQYARKVDAALRPVLAGRHTPLILAAAEPLASLYRLVNSNVDLFPRTIEGNPDRTTDADLATAARLWLDQLYGEEIAAFGQLFAARAYQRRTTTDIAVAARAATFGAIDSLLVDIDEVVVGTVDEDSGAVSFADRPGWDSYGVVDEIAGRALATGAKVLGVRKADIPGGASLAAILRYPF